MNLLVSLFVALTIGCVSADSAATDAGPGSSDAAPTEDAGARRDAERLPDSARGRADDDGNTGLGDAPSIELGALVSGTLTSEDDFDYLRIDATEGTYLAIVQRERSDFFGPSVVLLDAASRPLLAGTDMNGCAGEPDVPTELVLRIPSTGSYYVELTPGLGSVRRDPQPWSIEVIDLATRPSTLVVREGTAAALGPGHRCVLGAFESAGDEDRFAVAIPAYRALFLYAPARHGSTGAPSVLELLDGSGGRIGRGSEALLLDDVDAPEVRLVAPLGRGANDHYLLLPRPPDFYGADVDQLEAADATNDDPASPELLSLPSPDPGTGAVPPFVARLPEGDVDHFVFDAAGPSSIDLECRGAALGTAVRGIELRVLAADGTVRALGRETSVFPARISSALEVGDVLRLSALSREPDVLGHAVVCWVRSGGR